MAQRSGGGWGFLGGGAMSLLQGFSVHFGTSRRAPLATTPAHRTRLRQLQSGGRWDEMIQLHAEAGQQNAALSSETNRYTDEQFQEMRKEVVRLSKIRRELSGSMFMTGLVILASIICMPLTPFFFRPTR